MNFYSITIIIIVSVTLIGEEKMKDYESVVVTLKRLG